ncbi:MAG TPA: aminoglycoside phosphotransferase family protein [Phototrophicaceae bacterium]|nr:aminoglycoside phosphotransferase family protein [Phototrophicaceae bacterium]
MWADSQPYFLKVKAEAVNELSVRLPRYLQQHGLAQVVAPLPTVTEKLWGQSNEYHVLLYPFIDGQPGSETRLSDRQWLEFGAVVKQLHTTPLSADLLARLPQETFIPHPKWYPLMNQLQTAVDRQNFDNSLQRQLADFWQARQAEINGIVARVQQLSQRLHGQPCERVLCHADIHPGNLLLAEPDRLYVVDWDQPMLAPKERDLMFVTVGGFIADPRHEALFFQGYGPTDIHPLVLAYYRYERVMEDLAEFAKQVFLVDSTDETKQDSIYWITRIFAPGNDVDAAHKLDDALD